jgi:hypothetical protein
MFVIFINIGRKIIMLVSFSLETLATLGFSEMTPVQAGVIPMFMKNKDVVIEVYLGNTFIVQIENYVKLYLGVCWYRQ